jgi:hypothetical protein
MQQTTSAINKQGSNLTKICLEKRMDISGWLIITTSFLHSIYTKKSCIKSTNCRYQVYETESKISYLQYMDHLKLIGRIKEESRNEIIIVKATMNDIKWNID